VVRITKYNNPALTHERRIRFAALLGTHKISSKNQLTADKQKELFAELEDWSDRCAFRSYLTREYEMLVAPEGDILREVDLIDVSLESEGVHV
jgi:hypothetical protein